MGDPMAEDHVKRKLSAILSADVKGYSLLMGNDEVGTIRTLESYKKLMSDLIQQHMGRVVDAPGDNILAEFASVVDAVRCSVEIQQLLKAKNDDLPKSRRMEFRIGINLGDVIEEGDRIYGEGVNIAARIEGLADPGGICISGSAYDQIENKLALKYEYLHEHNVKNITKPVRVYKILMEPMYVSANESIGSKKWQISNLSVLIILVIAVVVVLIWNLYFRLGPLQENGVPDQQQDHEQLEKPSIAVLPFVNISGDTDQEYFSDGITEELITAFTRIPGLRVIARTSVFVFKGKDIDIRSIGGQLNVSTVMEGSIRKDGNSLRISAQLINVADNSHLWAKTYDREMEDIFTIQEEIARKIVDALHVRLMGKDEIQLVKRTTENMEAFNLYLRANSTPRIPPTNHWDIIKLYEKIIELDPNFAPVYTQLAYILAFEKAPWNPPQLQDDRLKRAEELTMRAFELDDTLSDVYSNIAQIRKLKWDWEGAEKNFKKAIELNPNLGHIHKQYADFLKTMGRYDEALRESMIAVELDPLSDSANAEYGVALRNMEQIEQAIEQQKKAIEMFPYYFILKFNLADTYRIIGNYDEAIAMYQNIRETSDNPPGTWGLIACYVAMDRNEEAQKIFDEVQKKRGINSSTLIPFARLHTLLGNKDKAIELLGQAVEEHNPKCEKIISGRDFFSLRSDTRFIKLLKRMGIEG
jgi:adenylate cyclase